MQSEVPVLDEEASDSTKIDTSEEVFNVDVEHESSSTMLHGVGDNRSTTLETVGDAIRLPASVCLSTLELNFFEAILEDICQIALQ